MYTYKYVSPIGEILLESDGEFLTGLWLDAKHLHTKPGGESEAELPIFKAARRWLEIYFAGREPNFSVPTRLTGTEFQLSVWEILCKIPYGCTTTYGAIAGKIAEKRGIPKMSAQAVGNAVGKNPISIIVPCHRVIGADGSLVGYGGGLDKKIFLLEVEGINTKKCR